MLYYKGQIINEGFFSDLKGSLSKAWETLTNKKDTEIEPEPIIEISQDDEQGGIVIEGPEPIVGNYYCYLNGDVYQNVQDGDIIVGAPVFGRDIPEDAEWDDNLRPGWYINADEPDHVYDISYDPPYDVTQNLQVPPIEYNVDQKDGEIIDHEIETFSDVEYTPTLPEDFYENIKVTSYLGNVDDKDQIVITVINNNGLPINIQKVYIAYSSSTNSYKPNSVSPQDFQTFINEINAKDITNDVTYNTETEVYLSYPFDINDKNLKDKNIKSIQVIVTFDNTNNDNIVYSTPKVPIILSKKLIPEPIDFNINGNRLQASDDEIIGYINIITTTVGETLCPEDLAGIIYWIGDKSTAPEEKDIKGIYHDYKDDKPNIIYKPFGDDDNYPIYVELPISKEDEKEKLNISDKDNTALWVCAIAKSLDKDYKQILNFGLASKVDLSDFIFAEDVENIEFEPAVFRRTINDNLTKIAMKARENERRKRAGMDAEAAADKEANLELARKKLEIEDKRATAELLNADGDHALKTTRAKEYANDRDFERELFYASRPMAAVNMFTNPNFDFSELVKNIKRNTSGPVRESVKPIIKSNRLNEDFSTVADKDTGKTYAMNKAFVIRMNETDTKLNISRIMPLPTQLLNLGDVNGVVRVAEHDMNYEYDKITKVTVEFARQPQTKYENGEFIFEDPSRIADIELANVGDMLKQMIESENNWGNYIDLKSDDKTAGLASEPSNDLTTCLLKGDGVAELNALIDGEKGDNYGLFMMLKFSGEAYGIKFENVPWDCIIEVSYEQLNMNPFTYDYRDLLKKMVERNVYFPQKDEERYKEVCAPTKLPKLKRLLGGLKGIFFKNPQSSVKNGKDFAKMYGLDDIFNPAAIKVSNESNLFTYNPYAELYEENVDNEIMSSNSNVKEISKNNALLLEQLVDFVPAFLNLFNHCVQITVGDPNSAEIMFRDETDQVLTMINMVGGQKKLSATEKVQKLMSCDLFKQFSSIGGESHDAEKSKQNAIGRMCEAIVKTMLGEDEKKKNSRELNFDCMSAWIEFKSQLVSLFSNKMATINPYAWGCVKEYRTQCSKLQGKADEQMKKIIEVMCGTGTGTDSVTKILQARFPMPFKQVELQHAWEGYNQQLIADIDEFVATFIDSDAFNYMRKIVINTLPNILAVCLFGIIMLGITVDGMNTTSAKNMSNY